MVGSLAVRSQIETLPFVLDADAQAEDGLDHVEQHQRADARPDDGDDHGLDLGEHLGAHGAGFDDEAGAADSEYTELIFADDFTADGFGEQWKHYKSGSVVKDGVLMGITPEGSDHPAVDSIRFEGRRDMEVSVKFNFVGTQGERFNIWFDDYNYKDSHAGHICSVSVSPTGGSIADAKTGAFENAIYEKKKSPEGLDADTLKMLETKTSRYPLELDRDEWHTLLVQTKANHVVVFIDGKEVGELESEGVGHLTKSLVSLTTNLVDVHYDDFSVRAAKVAAEE